MVKRPADMNAFEFAVVSGLRAAQLQRGCTPLVEQYEKVIVTAQHEVAERKVLRIAAVIDTLCVEVDGHVAAAPTDLTLT